VAASRYRFQGAMGAPVFQSWITSQTAGVMKKHELLQALAPFDDETFICVRMKLADGNFFEFPILAVEYMPIKDERDAYLAMKTQI
jgi:hypothetical protein